EGLAISEVILPSGHPALASLYANLGAILVRQGRPKAAAPFLRHGFELIEKAAGGPNQNSATMRMMFATAIAANQPQEAIVFLDAALPIIEGQLGAESKRAIDSHEVRAVALMGLGQFDQALAEQRRVVEVRERKLLPQHRDRMSGRAVLAKIALAKGDLVLAEKSAADGVALRSTVVPASHPDLLAERSLLVLVRSRAKTAASAKSLTEAHDIYDRLVANAALDPAAPMLENARFAFRNIAEVMLREGDKDGAFKAQQWSARSSVDEAAASAAATRAEAGRPAIKLAMDGRRKLVAERAAIMASVEAQIAAPKAEFDLTAANARITGVETKISEANRLLAAGGAVPGQFIATSIAAAQSRIGKKQLYLQVTGGQDHYLVTALSPEGVLQYLTSETARKIADRVTAIRATLDSEGEEGAFDRVDAARLYQTLISPALARRLRGTNHVLVSANDALGALPFAVLVPDAKAQAYLIDRVAISRMPGAPQEKGAMALPSPRLFAMGNAVQTAGGGTGSKVRGGRAEVLANLPALPQAAAEMRDLAIAVRARDPQILTGDRATKAALQSAHIAAGTVVAFATHGLVTGEIEGLREPALLLSAAGSDDGLLTASEISRMDIPASWVVLSACNTAAGSGPDAPSLSGLAQAFILAGANNILATYWPVRDDVARALSSGTLRRAAAGVPPAEALRQSIGDLRKGPLSGAQSPRQWAAFELIVH
ncbi:MAG: CHAT domain-containing protein, partial [Novosphingobium sp.]